MKKANVKELLLNNPLNNTLSLKQGRMKGSNLYSGLLKRRCAPRSCYLLVSMAVMALFAPGGTILPQTAQAAQNAWPVRDFLPPVATINPRVEETATPKADRTVEPVALTAITSPVIHTRPRVERLVGTPEGLIQSGQAEDILTMQQKVDEADMEFLWRATVEKNPIIRFSLEKLAMPSDLQNKHSSRFLNKTLAMLIQGGTLATTMIPGPAAGAYRNMGAMAVGNALQNLTDGRTKPAPGSLSNTEQIQLAHLIDELKLKIIQKYQDYKNTLQALAQSRDVTAQRNNEYSKALASHDNLAVMTAGTSYYQALLNETDLRQKAKLYRLELERLAGPDAVSGLLLSVGAPGTLDARLAVGEGMPATQSDLPPEGREVGKALPGTTLPVSVIGPASPTLEPPGELPPVMEIGPRLTQESAALIGPSPPSASPAKHSVIPNKSKSPAVKKPVARRSVGRRNVRRANVAPKKNAASTPMPDPILELKETP